MVPYSSWALRHWAPACVCVCGGVWGCVGGQGGWEVGGVGQVRLSDRPYWGAGEWQRQVQWWRRSGQLWHKCTSRQEGERGRSGRSAGGVQEACRRRAGGLVALVVCMHTLSCLYCLYCLYCVYCVYCLCCLCCRAPWAHADMSELKVMTLGAQPSLAMWLKHCSASSHLQQGGARLCGHFFLRVYFICVGTWSTWYSSAPHELATRESTAYTVQTC